MDATYMTTIAVLTTTDTTPLKRPSMTTGSASLTIMLPRISVVRSKCEFFLHFLYASTMPKVQLEADVPNWHDKPSILLVLRCS